MSPGTRDTVRFFALLILAGALTYLLTLAIGGGL